MRQALVAAVLSVATIALTSAQARVPRTAADEGVPVAVALKVGGDAVALSGKGTCTYAPVASIYAVRAEQWRVEHSSGDQRFSLTLWHPSNGADMFSLALSGGRARHTVNTVKVGTNGSVEGSGTVTITREGKGGTFTVNAAEANGTKIAGTIKCDAFTAAIAEGGL